MSTVDVKGLTEKTENFIHLMVQLFCQKSSTMWNRPASVLYSYY